MTPLETRLRSLRQPGGPAPSPAELRGRSAARGRRRLFTAAAVAVPFIAVALAVFVAATEPGDQVRDREDRSGRPDPNRYASGEPGPTAPLPEEQRYRILGALRGVTMEVSPSTGLRDGELVEVGVGGLERLPGAQFFQCAGDVVAEDVLTACTAESVERLRQDPTTPVTARAGQVVSVSRTIHITRGSGDPLVTRPYDCATEPAGCVLAVGLYELPARAVVVPLTFVAEPAPVPEVSITPSTGLTDGQPVTLVAEGLRPNGAFTVQSCAASSNRCDEAGSARSDDAGSLTAAITARTSLYGEEGRIDCVTSSSAVVLRDDDTRVAEVPFQFAPGVMASVPELRLDPPGPYTDGQTVTVHGTGFPPGFDLGGHLGQCPADKDTAVEERCTYPVITPIIVDAAGRFTVAMRLSDTTFAGSCMTGPGCLLAWVLNHGPIAASAPLDFSP